MQIEVRALTPSCHVEITQVAARMRETLVEVLGSEKGAAMYTPEWLQERVRFHLDASRAAAVFVAESEGQLIGHTIVRRETPTGDQGPAETKDQPFGLFSTTYVLPEHRRDHVASQLLEVGEAWMRQQGLHWAATDTSSSNSKLIRLYEGRGYTLAYEAATPDAGTMVRLLRRL